MKIKRIIALCLSIFGAFSLAACAEYRAPQNPDPAGDEPTVPVTPVTPDDGKNVFDVTLMCDGVPFPLVKPERTVAKWMSGANTYTAKFDSSGVAKISGLDGDYRVTVDGIPQGYTYDPNINTATNDRKSTKIELHRLTPYTGSGRDLYDNIITIDEPGYYRATVRSADSSVYFQYRPTDLKGGEYSITSLVDVNENTVNPFFDDYGGNSSWKPDRPNETVDGGGVSGTYTKNFKQVMGQYSDSVGEGAVFAFGISAESLNKDAYPVTVDFKISRDGDHEREDIVYETVVPTENFSVHAVPSGTFDYAGKRNGGRCDTNLFKLNPADGYYHLYDATTDTYGAMLFAKIGQEIPGILGASGGFMNTQVTLRVNGKDYSAFIREGYGLYLNADRCYPVTEELKTFLQDYASAQNLFFDGNGMAEVGGGLSAAEEDMWLFACGYY